MKHDSPRHFFRPIADSRQPIAVIPFLKTPGNKGNGYRLSAVGIRPDKT